ncbi:helix-turn-helix domain-containing protein [Bacillus licheniformis]|uniref:helix-turn-helix domain-containing protein n=1 Tax=Bacillus licheniformis TaxID=1402 RepID=UPI00092842DF|nr:helix-turn-helix transcriptional regulator [Bacillus licheniformis]MCY7774062.1 helix-turn-helix domain-containing protein [Bacillus licheniformis]MCY8159644.1 helix-turn-helix domain-containing protein [Bacillus licheniformis]MCY8531145.1 helix-turn-helix domain-containing protein [Bacillus licheniformis]MCY9284860.1 helix-turn-helix domain-containing protein [Bacillus licheniformis]MEC1389057.1 helix-turn-helix transcriptional regulator [Bacillus licheniformis]
MELDFGKRVKTWLIINGMQQKDLAKMLNISNAYLSDILLGKRKGKKVRDKIVKILNLEEVS